MLCQPGVLLLEPQIFFLESACMHWLKEMHKQEFAVQKEKKFNIELVCKEMKSLCSKTQLPDSM